jgi:hypothetical protein
MTRFALLIILAWAGLLQAQSPSDSARSEPPAVNADDPSQFITRIEVYNELQYRNEGDYYLNQAVFRAIVKLGKRFTTRVDIPYVSNTIGSASSEQQSGLGDVSVRLLGYQLFQRPKSALTASFEMSFNTAGSPFLGAGKNVVIPMVTYSLLMPKQKMLFSAFLQQANSVSGEEARRDVSFTKLQLIVLRYWSRKTWTLVALEWYYDYVGNGLSMNLRGRITHAPSPRVNVWFTPSVGVFGDFFARYTWSLDVGGRYFLFRNRG